MTTKGKKIISYTTFIAADIASLLVTVAAVQLTFYAPSIELSTELVVGIWGILVPLSAGLLTAALLFAASLLAAPVLACMYLINEITRRDSRSRSHKHAIIPTTPFIPSRVGTLNSSGNTMRGGFVGTASQPAGNVYHGVNHGVNSAKADPKGNSISLE